MTRHEFITALTGRLAHLPWEDVKERVDFYTEAIDDRIEEGLSEEEAVAAVGDPEEIAALIMAEIPWSAPEAPRKEQRRKLGAGEILLLILGSPLWLSLLIAAASVIISLYVSLWAVVISLWAVFVSLLGCALGGVVGGAFLAFIDTSSGIFLIGAGIFCAGAAIFLFFGCKAATVGTVRLGAYMIKNLFRKRRAV